MEDTIELEKLSILIGVKTQELVQDFARFLDHEYQLFFATQGRELLDIARKKQADLILLEDELAAIETTDLCSLLHKDPRTHSIPVVIITKTINDDLIQRFGSIATDYLHFPDHPAILKAHLRTILELCHYRDFFNGEKVADSLAEIADWPVFEEYLRHEWRRGIRYQTPQSLIIADIDFFDAFEQFYGISLAEDCFNQIAMVMVKCATRVTDIISRHGASEFTLLMPETDVRGGLKVAQRIQEMVEMLNIPHANCPIADHVTLSIGVATLLPNENQKSFELFLKASELLREAKRNGHNQIQIMGPEYL